MTVFLDEAGQGHAVMMVRTDRGNYILDNRRQAVLAWSDTGYTYIKQEGSQGLAWVALGEQKTGRIDSKPVSRVAGDRSLGRRSGYPG